MNDPILKSIKKYRNNKRLIYENQEASLDVKSSKFLKEIRSSLNDVIKSGVIVNITSFKYNYPNYVKMVGTFDGDLTWMYVVDEKSKFLIQSSKLMSFSSKKADELKKLATYFESESFNSQIREALQNKSFS